MAAKRSSKYREYETDIFTNRAALVVHVCLWDPFGFTTSYLQEDVYPDEDVGLPVALDESFGEFWRP
jgi:hypothetical protein